MNKDHQPDLSAILQHTLGISCPNPQLTDITLSSLTISANGQVHTVPISPPMNSWSDRRARLVDMTLAARQALGLSDDGTPLKVTRFLAPRGFGAIVFCAVVFYFGCYAAVAGGFVEPGTGAWGLLERVGFPGGPEAFRGIVGRIFWPVLAIHVAEIWWLDRTRLARYGVARGSGLWWAWMGCCFFEGGPTFLKFDGEVDALRRKKE
jgi:hypothetical protein